MDSTTHHDQRIGFAGIFQCLFQTFGVFATVFELQGVHRQNFLTDFIATFVVQKAVEPGPCTNAMVVAAAWADVLVLLQVGLVENRLTTWALDPQTFRHAAAVRRIGLLNFRG